MTADEEKLEAFTAWLEEEGVDTPLKSTYINGRRGAIALEDIEEGDSIMRIPKDVLISEDSARSGDLQAFFEQEAANPLFEDPLIVVAVQLVYERSKPDSYWKPFFDIMPETFHLPLEFTPVEELLLELVLTPASLETRKQTIEKLKEVAAVLAANPTFFGPQHNLAGLSVSFPLLTLQALIWAVSLIWSRAFKVGGRACVVPLADMLNHKHPTEDNYVTDYKFVEAFDCFAMSSEMDYQEGDEVFNQYGFRSNTELFEFYGFVDPDNPNETFECFLSEADLADWTDVAAKQELLRESYIDPLYFTIGSGQSPGLVAAAAVVLLYADRRPSGWRVSYGPEFLPLAAPLLVPILERRLASLATPEQLGAYAMQNPGIAKERLELTAAFLEGRRRFLTRRIQEFSNEQVK